MDAEVARLGPPCFGDMQSPALLLYRYMSIFCPRDLAMSESRAAERSRLILGSAILTRLSELLIDATETVRNVVWKSDEVPGDDHDDNRARREAGLQELAVLFFCLNGVCRLLEIGRVRPMIVSPFCPLPPPFPSPQPPPARLPRRPDAHRLGQGGNLFQHAFVEHLSRWIQVLQKHVARACSEREEWWGRIGFRNIEQLRFRNWAVKLRLVYEPCGHRQNDADSEVSIASDRDRSASVFTDVPASDVTDGLDQTLVAADDSPSEQYFYSEAVSPAPPRNGDGGDCFGNDIRLGTIDELHAIPQSPRPLATSALGACSVSHHVGYYTASDVLSPLPNPGESPSFWTGTPASVPRTAYTHTYLDHSPAFLQVNSATASWERLENRCPAPIVTPGPQPLEYPQQQQQQQQHDDPLPLLPPYSAWPARRGNDILFDSSHGYGSWQGPRYT